MVVSAARGGLQRVCIDPHAGSSQFLGGFRLWGDVRACDLLAVDLRSSIGFSFSSMGICDALLWIAGGVLVHKL